MTNKEYTKARNKLIPIAEKYANSEASKEKPFEKDREEWVIEWNRLFLGKMDELVKEILIYEKNR